MKNIVKVDDTQLVVTIKDVANFSGNKQKSIRDLILRNHESFKELGLSLNKEYDLKSQSEMKLNEEQTTFLMILMRNNPTVVKFKLELVKQFMKLKSSANKYHQHQLKEKDKQIIEAKRKTYAHSREGKFHCVTNILRDTGANISAEVFNKLLLERKYISQKEVTVKKYIANEKESTTSLDGTVLVHYDTAISILKDFDVEFEEGNQMKMDF